MILGVYYRSGINVNNNYQNSYGTKWTEVPGSMVTLSLSCTNQVKLFNSFF
jgi:hypothetical protein